MSWGKGVLFSAEFATVGDLSMGCLEHLGFSYTESKTITDENRPESETDA